MKFIKGQFIMWGLLMATPWALASWVFFAKPTSYLLRDENPFESWLINEVSLNLRSEKYPTSLMWGEDNKREALNIEYTLDAPMQAQADKLLAQYKPDYGAIVVLEASTGRIMALSSFERNPQFNENLAMKASFPAASIFKMVTAATAVDKFRSDPDHTILFNGGNHTLYKRNVMSETVNKWTREVTLRKAFALSLNTAFGRLAIETLGPKDISDYAYKFGFNREIGGDIKFDRGYTEIPSERDFALAEVASGFNRITRMSPLQGALMASVVANEGIMPKPKIIERVTNQKGEVLYVFKPESDAQILSPEGVAKMRDLMDATVSEGTSRKSFRSLRRDRKLTELEVGGKTGSLQGLNPKGRTEWFVGYALSPTGEKLAVATLTVNVTKWTVKSSELAKQILQTHFKNMKNWVAENQ